MRTQFPVPSAKVSLGHMPVPLRETPPLPPCVAEKVTAPLRFPLADGLKTMRTVQEAPGAKVFTMDPQSPALPLWIANSLLLEATEMTPLVDSPVFVIVNS